MDDLRLQLPNFLPIVREIVVAYVGAVPKSFNSANLRSDRLERAGNEPLRTNSWAIAFRKSDGSVATWGNLGSGGDSSSVQDRLKNVKGLCASEGAFAAIVGEDNTVVTWGERDSGGDSSSVAGELKDVEGICATDDSFAALRRDGTVVTWGRKGHHGAVSPQSDKTRVAPRASVD